MNDRTDYVHNDCKLFFAIEEDCDFSWISLLMLFEKWDFLFLVSFVSLLKEEHFKNCFHLFQKKLAIGDNYFLSSFSSPLFAINFIISFPILVIRLIKIERAMRAVFSFYKVKPRNDRFLK